MAYWTFYDYVSEDGTNEIEAWINGLQHREDVRAKLRARLEYLQDVEHPEIEPYMEALRGDCSGLFAVKFRVQELRCRPMSIKGPGDGEWTLLVGAKKAGRDIYDPRRACRIAFERWYVVDNDRGRITKHDYT